jgi:hypothetical protein
MNRTICVHLRRAATLADSWDPGPPSTNFGKKQSLYSLLAATLTDSWDPGAAKRELWQEAVALLAFPDRAGEGDGVGSCRASLQ